MNMRTEFGIIVRDEHRFSLWPTHHALPPGWQFTGITGTRAEMEELLLQVVETAPATNDALDTPLSFSQWEDTASGALLA